MKSLSFAASPLRALHNDIAFKLLVAAVIVGVADWLFYGHRLGLSAAIFLLVLAGASLIANPVTADPRRIAWTAAFLFLGLLPVVEDFNALSVTIGIISTAFAVSSLTNPFIENIDDRIIAARKILLTGPFRFLSDLSNMQSRSLSVSHVVVWIVPLAVSALFLFLFASANPLIESWLSLIDLQALLAALNGWRILLWAAVLLATWRFISTHWQRKKSQEARIKETEATAPEAPNAIFGPAAILRSLVLFNILFAIESVLDLVYLWGGVTLPDGMTYASYAHRGAYPLMATALLAAAFVLAAMRPGGPAERIPAIRMLVFLWVAQNVMLVISSILRLDLYVEVYSLTYWRVAALVWMIVVAIGLVLIVTRIALNRSNKWLVLANLAALTAILYICALINLPLVIANYNVSHSQELSGKGVKLDFHYLTCLGPQALPAIDRYLRHPSRSSQSVTEENKFIPSMDSRREALVSRHRAESADWRAWGLRGWRLQRYLDSFSTKSGASNVSPGRAFL